MKRLTAFVSGKVQRTGYRAKAVNLAKFLGLTGFVQNLPDGRVKVVAEGEQAALEHFLAELKIRDSLIDVQDIEFQYLPYLGDFIRFEKMVANGETDQRLDKAAELLSELIVVNKQIAAQLIVNNDEIRGVREEIKGVGEEVKGVRLDIQAVHEEVKGSRMDIRAVYEEVKGVRDEVKASRLDIRSVQDEVRGSREDLGGVRDSLQEVLQEVRHEVGSSGSMIAERIDDAREEIAGEVKELRADLRDDLKERLARMEADVSQIKAKIGL